MWPFGITSHIHAVWLPACFSAQSFSLYVVVIVVVYFILSRLFFLAYLASLSLLCMLHPSMGPLVQRPLQRTAAWAGPLGYSPRTPLPGELLIYVPCACFIFIFQLLIHIKLRFTFVLILHLLSSCVNIYCVSPCLMIWL